VEFKYRRAWPLSCLGTIVGAGVFVCMAVKVNYPEATDLGNHGSPGLEEELDAYLLAINMLWKKYLWFSFFVRFIKMLWPILKSDCLWWVIAE